MISDSGIRSVFLFFLLALLATFPVGAADAESFRREEAVLSQAADAIARNRQREAVLVVRDAAGNAAPDVNLTVELVRHEFLFGCNIFEFERLGAEADNREYERRFAGLFNYATVGFYWRPFEPEPGRPQYPYTDKVVAWCAARGIRMKGHPLLWPQHPAGVPAWLEGKEIPPELARARVEEIITRYRGKIDFWEVVNEAGHGHLRRGIVIDEPQRWARAADPQAHLIVNDYRILWDGYPAFHDFLKGLNERGVPYDGVGIQAHESRAGDGLPGFPGRNGTPPRFPLDRVKDVLDRYAALGKSLHPPTHSPHVAHSRHGKDRRGRASGLARLFRNLPGHGGLAGTESGARGPPRQRRPGRADPHAGQPRRTHAINCAST